MSKITPIKELSRDEKYALLRSPIRIQIIGGRSWGGTSTLIHGDVPRPGGATFDESYYQSSNLLAQL